MNEWNAGLHRIEFFCVRAYASFPSSRSTSRIRRAGASAVVCVDITASRLSKCQTAQERESRGTGRDSRRLVVIILIIVLQVSNYKIISNSLLCLFIHNFL